MRELRFNVDKQRLKRDPKTSFSGIMSGSKGYLLASFTFSMDWAGLKKVAAFRTDRGVNTYKPIGLDNTCEIPDEITGDDMTYVPKIYVCVIGRGAGVNLMTNEVAIMQTRPAIN